MTNNTQYGFHYDASKCNGCKGCHIICKSRFDGEDGVIPRRVYEYVGGGYADNNDGTVTSNTFAYYTSISCNHCSEPVCVKACPTGAMHKRSKDGLVHVSSDLCIGCSSCAKACPYDAPQLDPVKKVMVKCDGCFELIAEGRKPLCVEGCPQRALDFGLIEDLKAKYPGSSIANVAPLPQASITSPNLLISTNRLSRPSGSSEGKIENLTEV
ncbi:4Fe-4S ferredoxin, iron-sulfur binding domain protein [Shewanella sediminis HAW-EB3]|uniref:4Fe-4S ferredoxin, iron-sulfur binding domain protein n=1 Tax=Shewanella sediminis (strain HAW-EB3) TaxID=425104 RepID=A8FSU6_SHESH|nr:DMSO/selenate family reductase complex B subunit [Shewanella sediminis]ABV35919.1 4Fe-4S ferredoxin, iron-sulfur binding domain protein [Shewanella sediminis HAW-EB3]